MLCTITEALSELRQENYSYDLFNLIYNQEYYFVIILMSKNCYRPFGQSENGVIKY